ncbi:hypothetical protein ACP70R_026113 [Stipagrostis hirtigluma subsp. patula]
MRTSHLVLVAIALLLLSSDVQVKGVSGLGPKNCQQRSRILYPGKPCDPQACQADCLKQYQGTGTCFTPPIGCDCEYCLHPSPSVQESG